MCLEASHTCILSSAGVGGLHSSLEVCELPPHIGIQRMSIQSMKDSTHLQIYTCVYAHIHKHGQLTRTHTHHTHAHTHAHTHHTHTHTLQRLQCMWSDPYSDSTLTEWTRLNQFEIFWRHLDGQETEESTELGFSDPAVYTVWGGRDRGNG